MTTNSDNLSDSDIADVLEMAQEASTKWYNIGLALGLHCSILEEIEASAAATQKCLLKGTVSRYIAKNRTAAMFWPKNADHVRTLN